MPLGMMVKEVTGMIALEELVAMVGAGITHIAVLLAQYTAHDLVLTMVAHQVLYMVHMAGAEVLFVIAIGDLLATDRDLRLPKGELMTNSEPSLLPGAGSLYPLFPNAIN